MPRVTALVNACLYIEGLDAAVAFYQGILARQRIGREEARHVFFSAGSRVLLYFLPQATLSGGALLGHGARARPHWPGHRHG